MHASFFFPKKPIPFTSNPFSFYAARFSLRVPMALLGRQLHRLALLASSQRSAASIHTTQPALAEGFSSPTPYLRPGPPSTASAEGLSKTAEFVISKVDDLMNWARHGSIWPMTFGLVCCAIEMMHTGAARYDLDRFRIIFRPNHEQFFRVIVVGTLTNKMAPAHLIGFFNAS